MFEYLSHGLASHKSQAGNLEADRSSQGLGAEWGPGAAVLFQPLAFMRKSSAEPPADRAVCVKRSSPEAFGQSPRSKVQNSPGRRSRADLRPAELRYAQLQSASIAWSFDRFPELKILPSKLWRPCHLDIGSPSSSHSGKRPT